MKADRRVTGDFRFVGVTLDEPPNEEVLNYQDGLDVPRDAFVILLESARWQCIEVIVSLSESAVLSWVALEGVQPAIMLDEFIDVRRP